MTVFDARPHGFESGDRVQFMEIDGMTELNGQKKEIRGKLERLQSCISSVPVNRKRARIDVIGTQMQIVTARSYRKFSKFRTVIPDMFPFF